ncbi:recombinase family protein [Kitasatospora purpeofusca]|uniref:recombinase family protein n=1 Tax=Kitasatospora purpeofusca TaxID=67352 RepID=UPI00225325B8|nr:recombinase family protein [Kitasatospora purpeofusca]MCX4685509.1 recombinase family protein [Kitasatospora purpeofusca]
MTSSDLALSAATLLATGRPKPVRVLISLRISELTDESTSLERQLFDSRQFIADRAHLGWVEVGVARDAHVSASKQSPFERAELGHWLKERAPEFDLILFWKLDRFIRKVLDMQDMLRWAADHGNKDFASVTEPIFDMTGPFRHVIIALFSALAEMEAKNTSVRVKSFRDSVRELTRWAGGMPAYGFEVYKEDGAAYLRQNPHQVNVLREVVNRLLTGDESHAAIADDLNARGELTARGTRPSKRIQDSGREYKWSASGLRKLLKNDALMGWKMETRPVPGKKYFETIPVINSDGHKVKVAEAIFTEEEWDALQGHLNGRTFKMSSPTNVTPFLDVIRCGYCRGKMRLHVMRRQRKDGALAEYPKFRCVSPRMVDGRTRYGCEEQVSWDPGRLLATFEHHLMDEFGDQEAEERIYVVGEDNAGRMKEIGELVSHLMADMEPGRRYGTALTRPKAEAMIDKLSAEYEALSKLPTGDRWEYRSLGQTWRELWEATEVEELEALTRRNGVQFFCYTEAFELVVPKRMKI